MIVSYVEIPSTNKIKNRNNSRPVMASILESVYLYIYILICS